MSLNMEYRDPCGSPQSLKQLDEYNVRNCAHRPGVTDSGNNHER